MVTSWKADRYLSKQTHLQPRHLAFTGQVTKHTIVKWPIGHWPLASAIYQLLVIVNQLLISIFYLNYVLLA